MKFLKKNNIKKTMLFFLVLLFIGCKKNENKNYFLKEDSNKEYYLYYSQDKNNELKVERFIIKDKSTKNVQKIDLSFIDELFSKYQSDFFLQDVNFDGINDIMIPNYIGTTDEKFSFFIYDKKNQSFYHKKELDNILNPEIITSKKQICSKWHYVTTSYNLYKYSWVGDSLMINEKYEENWSPYDGKGYLKISKFENGKWDISEKEIKQRFVENMKCD